MHAARLKSEVGGEKFPAELKQSVFVGCSGWRYWKWRDSFYEGVPQNDWFGHDLKRFDTVEINASFYSWPTIAGVKSWRRQPDRKKFVYTVKVCELITHIKKFKGTTTLLEDFGMIADILGDEWAVFCFNYRRAIASPEPGSMTSSTSSNPRAATSSNSGTSVGGTKRFTALSERLGSSSAPAADRACPMSSSGQRMRFTSACTDPSAGTGTTIQRKSWQSGQTGSGSAGQLAPGFISITTMTRMLPETRRPCNGCWAAPCWARVPLELCRSRKRSQRFREVVR